MEHIAVAVVDDIVLKRGRRGQTWRDRWDAFCLVTPNWSVRLPGRSYNGADPDGFMPREDAAIVATQIAERIRHRVPDGGKQF